MVLFFTRKTKFSHNILTIIMPKELYFTNFYASIDIAGIYAYISTVTYNASLVASELPLHKGPASES